jgi:hypothetical protein
MPWSSDPQVLDNVVRQVVAKPVLKNSDDKEDIARVERLLELKMRGLSITAIAALMCVTRNTIYAWMSEPLYIDRYAALVKENLSVTKDGFNGGGIDATQLLRDAVTNITVPIEHRIATAKFMIEKQLAFGEALQRADSNLDEEGLVPVQR